MNEITSGMQAGTGERCVVWRALAAISVGVCLGALAKLPYDRLIGFSKPACLALRSWICLAMMTSLSARGLPAPAP